MLYFKALREGLDVLPAADPALRAALDAEAAQRGWPAMHAELARVDPESAARLAPNDAQRVQRALEVWRASARPLSEWQGRRGAAAGTPVGASLEWPLVSLEPHSRAWLHERIAHRFEAMLAGGLLDEVRQLRDRGDLHPALPSMRCVHSMRVRQRVLPAAAYPPRDNSPNGSSPGCARCPSARSWRPMRPMPSQGAS